MNLRTGKHGNPKVGLTLGVVKPFGYASLKPTYSQDLAVPLTMTLSANAKYVCRSMETCLTWVTLMMNVVNIKHMKYSCGKVHHRPVILCNELVMMPGSVDHLVLMF